MNKKTILSGAIILSIAGIITRLMGFVYRIYMSNVIGAEGMGLYQLVIPVYGLVWSISCSGITTTISKLTAQENVKGEHGNVRLILKQSTIIATSVSVILSVIVYFKAHTIAVLFFNDARIILSLQLLSLAFPFMAMGSCIRGYFFGMQKTLVPAINQVLEQTVRMIVIYLLAGTFIPMGIEFACAAAIIGIVAEEIFSLIYIVLSYKRHTVKKTNKYLKSLTPQASLFLILSMSLPLTANRVVGSFLSTYENILIPQRLQMFGMSVSESISTFGQITGMAMPLIFFPTSFLISLSVSLIPAISEASAIKNIKDITYTVNKSMLFASIVGFGSSAMFINFSNELGSVIYKQDLGEMLMLLGLTCPFLYMQIILSGVLNGLGYQMFIFKNSLLSSLINIGFIYVLIPKIGINGFIIGWFISIVIICSLEIDKLIKNVNLHFEFGNWLLKPFLSSVAAGLAVKIISKNYISPIFSPVASLIISISILAFLYSIFIIATDVLSIKEIIHIVNSVKPKGRRNKFH
jgi:stage V sporulation protein B